jgi:myo-inositol catabolism protein IolH
MGGPAATTAGPPLSLIALAFAPLLPAGKVFAFMKIALDPHMLRKGPLLELPALVAELGYEYIELSPRDDFIPFFRHPRVDDGTVRQFRKALDAAGVKISSVLPLFRWSGPDEDERQAAVRYWKRAIQITADLGVDSMISEFNGRPEDPSRSEGQFWRSIEELLPVFEREGIQLTLEPHPDDFIEDGYEAINLIRGINHPRSPSSTAPRTPSTTATTPPV